jgi:uncharacterized protein
MSRNRRRLLLPVVVLSLLGALLTGTAASADPPTYRTGYIPVAVGTPDETTLHYKVMLPDPARWGDGPFPAIVDYSGYLPAQNVYDGLDDRFHDLGYAVVGLNMRGSGCSGGTFDYFEPLQSRDGAEAIEWLAKQDWSNGRIGMAGKSYPGITQLFVAAEQPEALKAIVPGHVFGDLYRDVPYPGGIMNVTFSAGWSAQRVNEGYVAGPQWWQSQGDQQCLENQRDHAPNLAYNPFVQALYNHFDGPLFQERSPFWFADRITAPTLLVQSWQDEQVGSRATHLIERFNPDLEWQLLASNGDHGEYYGEEMFGHIVRFFSYHLRQEVPEVDRARFGDDFEAAFAAFTAEDPVIINWENGAKGGRRSAWTETYSDWPPAETDVWRLNLTADGALTEKAHAPAAPQTKSDAANARLAGAVDYRYVPGVGTQARGGHALASGAPQARWTDKPPAGTFAAFTTAPLDADKVLLGSASVDLYVSSTAADTDFQVTLTEVRPDGQEMFVQQGWLRASHRLEESRFSTELRPFQSHRLGDSAPLVPGHPTKVRIEVFPFGHTFRAGSKLRISVEAPHTMPDLWGFTALPTVANNTIYTSSLFPSSVALPLIDGATAGAPLSPCTLRNQPCRPA